jgi:outer membrane protein TolC
MALDLAQKSYKEGMINITERLATETEMQNAELEYLQAVFAQRQSVLECYKATGDLTLSNIR